MKFLHDTEMCILYSEGTVVLYTKLIKLFNSLSLGMDQTIKNVYSEEDAVTAAFDSLQQSVRYKQRSRPCYIPGGPQKVEQLIFQDFALIIFFHLAG